MSPQGSLSQIDVVCGELLDEDGFLATLGAARGTCSTTRTSSASMPAGGVGRLIHRRCWRRCCWPRSSTGCRIGKRSDGLGLICLGRRRWACRWSIGVSLMCAWWSSGLGWSKQEWTAGFTSGWSGWPSPAGVVGHRRVVDSTGIADSVVTQDTVSLIRSAIRRCLSLLEPISPEKAQACRASLARDDYDQQGKPEICWASEVERQALVNGLFADACRVIIACAGITDPILVAEVKLLATVAAQDVEDDGAGGVRVAKRVASERVISTVDPDARHGHRSRRDRYDGYKLHISVDVDSDLFVAGQATTATTGDGEVLQGLLEDDPVAVGEVIGDTHYGSGEKRSDMAEAGVELTAPAPPPRR